MKKLISWASVLVSRFQFSWFFPWFWSVICSNTRNSFSSLQFYVNKISFLVFGKLIVDCPSHLSFSERCFYIILSWSWPIDFHNFNTSTSRCSIRSFLRSKSSLVNMFFYWRKWFDEVVFSNWWLFRSFSLNVSHVSIFWNRWGGFIQRFFFCLVFKIAHWTRSLFPFKNDLFHDCDSFLFVHYSFSMGIPIY